MLKSTENLGFHNKCGIQRLTFLDANGEENTLVKCNVAFFCSLDPESDTFNRLVALLGLNQLSENAFDVAHHNNRSGEYRPNDYVRAPSESLKQLVGRNIFKGSPLHQRQYQVTGVDPDSSVRKKNGETTCRHIEIYCRSAAHKNEKISINLHLTESGCGKRDDAGLQRGVDSLLGRSFSALNTAGIFSAPRREPQHEPAFRLAADDFPALGTCKA